MGTQNGKYLNNEIKCDLCGCLIFKKLYEKIEKGYQILKCLSCGFVFVYPQSTAGKELDSYYQDASAVKDNDLVRFKKRLSQLNSPIRKAILKEFYGYKNIATTWNNGLSKIFVFLLLPFFCKDTIPFQGRGRILDIGCGSGLSLSLLKSIGWDVYGVEVNKFACDYAAKMGVNIFCGELEKANFTPGFFDVIKITQVLEHLPSTDLVFAQMKRILKPGGTIYLEVPNLKSFAASCFKEKWLGIGGHLTAFSAETLSYIGKKHGLSMKKIRFKSNKGIILISLNYFWMDKFKCPLPNSILKNKAFYVLIVKPLCAALNLFHRGDTISVRFVIS